MVLHAHHLLASIATSKGCFFLTLVISLSECKIDKMGHVCNTGLPRLAISIRMGSAAVHVSGWVWMAGLGQPEQPYLARAPHPDCLVLGRIRICACKCPEVWGLLCSDEHGGGGEART